VSFLSHTIKEIIVPEAATPPPQSAPDDPNVIPFQRPTTVAGTGRISSQEAIWGKAVLSHGYTGIPSILIQAQVRLGLNPVKMNIIVQLLDYWREPTRRPFPSKRELAERIDVTEKTIQNNIRALEKAGLVQRIARYTRHRDPDSNVYNLDGLIKRVQDEIEPAFDEHRKKKNEERRRVQRGPRRP
jgi:DNA-binding transcriptional regulator YhcF (GntR family)